MTVEMAQFPLQSVLLPGMPLGLQVFEPRYLQLLDDVAEADNRFGVVLITHGSEVGGEDKRARVGTIAEIVRKRDVGSGRWVIEALGTQRYRVVSWLEDNPYPRAEIEVWPLPSEPDDSDELQAARDRFDEFLAVVGELGVDTTQLTLTDDPKSALYEMAATVPIAAFDRYRILAGATIGETATTLADAIGGAIEILRARLEER